MTIMNAVVWFVCFLVWSLIMLDSRIAVEETVADLTDVEIAELNAWHDECDARDDEREECESLYSTISDLSYEANYWFDEIDDLYREMGW